MAQAINIQRDAIKKSNESKFFQPITNTSGLEAERSASILKQMSLTDPPGYTALRANIYLDTLEKMMNTNYQIVWKLLAEGLYPGKEEGADDIQINVSGQPWSPNLPHQEISRLANGFALAIKASFAKLLEEVMPDNYKAMAETQMKTVGKIQGALPQASAPLDRAQAQLQGSGSGSN
jgi:hypothetical protein